MLNFTIDASRCIQCAACVDDCPAGIIRLQDNVPYIPEKLESRCIHCQHCLAVCPAGALSILGKDPDHSDPVAPPDPQAMASRIRSRRSVRSYSPNPVPAQELDQLLATLAYAPTGRNERQVRLTVVDDPVVMESIRQQTMAGIRMATARGTIPDHLSFLSRMLDPFDAGRDIIFRHAPHMLIASAPDKGATPWADVFISLSYFELMAQSMGLGTLWCGYAMWALRDVVPELLAKLGVPGDHQAMYVMLFGYPAVSYARTVQRSPRSVHRVRPEDVAIQMGQDK